MQILKEWTPTLVHELFEEQAVARTAGKEGTELRLPNAMTYFKFVLLDGRSEDFHLAPLVDMEYVVFEPTVNEFGDVTIPLEVMRFENSAESKVLWPGERLTVRGGVRTHPEAKHIYGVVQVPVGRELESGVLNRQTLWSRFWTPLGELTMRDPVNMSGVVTRFTPPLKTRLFSDRPIPLFDPSGDHVATIYNCLTGD
jgi:hypothetical protein